MANLANSWGPLALCAALLLASGSADASLGGDVASVEADRVHLKGASTVRQAQHYTLHEIAQENGTTVRQYVSPAGKVFAVAWEGAVLPDLKQVLGPYFDRYVEAAKNKRLKRTPIVIREPSLVVVTGGRLRAFSGRAWVPDLVPQDVDVEALP